MTVVVNLSAFLRRIVQRLGEGGGIVQRLGANRPGLIVFGASCLTFVRFVDYKIDLNSFLSSHRSDSYQNKSGGKTTAQKRVQAAEFYLSRLVFSTFRSFSQMPVMFYHSVIQRLGFFI